jgi:signal transduction histidine kinase
MTESRARLMRGFTHDVRNPLSVADMQAWMLEDGKLGELSPRQRESAQRIRRAIRSSLRLINDLLELSRAEAGQLDLRVEPTDVGCAARETAEDFRPQAAAIGLALEIHAPDGLLVRTDPARLRQVLNNLLSNALKYAPDGQVTVDAALQTAGGPKPGAWIAVRVADTGPGIPLDKRELIFHEYARLDPHGQQGAGIGLAISRRIARLLGGDLTVESEAGQGTAFTLWLPSGAMGQGAAPGG